MSKADTVKTMRDEYDFSKAERGKFHCRDDQQSLPVYLDADVLAYFTEKARSRGEDPHQLVNDTLKKSISLANTTK